MRQLLVLSLLGFAASAASAQGVYRIVGPDGRVTFSDQPPAASPAPAATAGGQRGASAAQGSRLPYELQQIANRYPVVLYTGQDCAPCDSGRRMLEARGIPFSEKTLGNTEDDLAALKRVGGDGTLPLLTIGGQRIKGYSDSEWGRYLDAAGYPAKSALPPGYRRPAASPLVAPAQASASPAAAEEAEEASPAENEVPVTPTDTNPAGIRF